MIISIVFCEGVHDIAFIMKIMKTYGYKERMDTVDKYPCPLSNLYVANKEETGVYGRNSKKIPFAVLEIKNQRMIVFHKMGGDSFAQDIKDIVEMYQMSWEIIDFYNNPDEIEGYEFIFFNDADDLGIENRVEQISEMLDGKPEIRHGEKIEKEIEEKIYKWGAYIFHNPSNGEKKGDLEDLLLSLMEPANESIFANSRNFLKDNGLEDTRKKKYDPFKGTYKRKDSANKNYKEKKSIIGIAGQLQFSGEANTVMIEYSDYISKEKIEKSAECRQIFELLDQ